MSFEWQGIVKTVAPLLGTAIGGPFGGMAAKFITGAILGDDAATDDIEIAKQAIANATPEQLAALKSAEYQFKTDMKQLDIDEKALDVEDRGGARDMQTKTRSLIPGFLALASFAGFFGILTALIFIEIPAVSISPLNIMLGVLGTLVIQIAAFYYGSSKGSQDKTDIISKAA